MKTWGILLLVSVTWLWGCSGNEPSTRVTAPNSTPGVISDSDQATTGGTQVSESTSDEDAVYDALFRHMFAKNASAAQQSAWTYFVTINGHNPSDRFLDRFQGHQPPVRRGSFFEQGKGLHFHIGSLQWIDNDTVDTTGGYYEGNVSASGNVYRLKRKGGKWVVVKDEMQWIS